MSAIDNLRIRMEYQGFNGDYSQKGRMEQSKLASLRKALLYSYQSEDITLEDDRKFKCLINSESLKNDYDVKAISIPFEDIELVSKEKQTIGMKCGDVFHWDKTFTDWIVYLTEYNEVAYYRAKIRRCKYTIAINGKNYKIYAKGPSVSKIDDKLKGSIDWNDLNYNLLIYITKNEDTDEFFKRFSVLKFEGNNYKVQTVDRYSTDNILEITAKEYYNNPLESEIEIPEIIEYLPTDIYIDGPNVIDAFAIVTYTMKNKSGGSWILNTTKAKIVSQTDTSITIEVLTGRENDMILQYRDSEDNIYSLDIHIETL